MGKQTASPQFSVATNALYAPECKRINATGYWEDTRDDSNKVLTSLKALWTARPAIRQAVSVLFTSL